MMNRSILDSIGNTPMVEIRSLNPNPRVRILAKLDIFDEDENIELCVRFQILKNTAHRINQNFTKTALDFISA
mgnify:CR=1 FL=1